MSQEQMSEENSNSNMSEVLTEKAKENSKERKRLKILAFHGYRQNGAVFRAKIGSFRKAVAKYAQLTFLSAPHRVLHEEGAGEEACSLPPTNLEYLDRSLNHAPIKLSTLSPNYWFDAECEAMRKERKAAEKLYCSQMTTENFEDYLKVAAKAKKLFREKKEKDSRSWWFNAEDNTFSGKCLGGPALGFETTLRVVERAVAEHGPFHGFMGFSQGACLVGLLAAMQQKGYLPYTFNFAIFASGFRSGSMVHKGFYDEEINLPSLHVYGEGDSIIPKEMSESLISLFTKPVVAEHSGGHYVACSGSIKDAYQDFLHDRCQDLLEEEPANILPKEEEDTR